MKEIIGPSDTWVLSACSGGRAGYSAKNMTRAAGFHQMASWRYKSR